MKDGEKRTGNQELIGAQFSARDAAELRMVSAALGTTVSTFVRASVRRCIKSIFPDAESGISNHENQKSINDNGQKN